MYRIMASGFIILMSLLLVPGAHASRPPDADTVATFSIVGYDPANGDLGVAVVSKFFAVGALVPLAEARVGAMAIQAMANPAFGPKGFGMLRLGLPAAEVLKNLIASDGGREMRQVGIVDASGNAATYTGKECRQWAGGMTGKNWTAQGNILVGQETIAAMGKAFEAAKGELAERLMAALEAGQAAGGDSRGRQSAAMVVARKDGGYMSQDDRHIDIRVDDAKEPVIELRRLLSIALANAWTQQVYALKYQQRHTEALAEINKAISAQPENKEFLYHRACLLSQAGRKEEALRDLQGALKALPQLAKQAATDSDLAPLHALPGFKALLSAVLPK